MRRDAPPLGDAPAALLLLCASARRRCDDVHAGLVIITARAMKYRDLIKLLEDDGWRHIRTTGCHFHYKHPTKPGLVTVPAGGKLSHDIPPGTLRSILRQAGLK